MNYRIVVWRQQYGDWYETTSREYATAAEALAVWPDVEREVEDAVADGCLDSATLYDPSGASMYGCGRDETEAERTASPFTLADVGLY